MLLPLQMVPIMQAQKVLADAFTTKSVMQYENYIRQVANQEIEKIKDNGGELCCYN